MRKCDHLFDLSIVFILIKAVVDIFCDHCVCVGTFLNVIMGWMFWMLVRTFVLGLPLKQKHMDLGFVPKRFYCRLFLSLVSKTNNGFKLKSSLHFKKGDTFIFTNIFSWKNSIKNDTYIIKIYSFFIVFRVTEYFTRVKENTNANT